MRVSFVLRSMVAFLMRRSSYDALDFVDVFQYRDGVLRLEEADEIVAARMFARGDADEGNPGGGGGARIVDGIAHVPQLTPGAGALDGEQSIGRWLGLRDVV